MPARVSKKPDIMVFVMVQRNKIGKIWEIHAMNSYHKMGITSGWNT